ncbi:MAG: HAD-IC family P-type ATPase [Candidatus Choladocola sp.]|nr:HAD-IC family P-type ATPase [Candidatus Choladocola sp.]
MKFIIKHEIRGRIRIHAAQSRMSAVQADTLAYYVGKLEGVTSVKVQERVQDAVICHTGDRETLILALRQFAYENVEVPVLDGTAIGVSVFRGDMETASSVMFLLGIGEILEEWTHKKSVADLARSMSLHVEKVWLQRDGQEILVPSEQIEPGDKVVVRMGNMVPFDGVVVTGDGMVNQASMTGESIPVHKSEGSTVYAGTVLEEGELTVLVREVTGSGKFDKIVSMIEESQKLKSSMEGKAEHLADRLVPYTLGGTALVYLLTRNVTKAKPTVVDVVPFVDEDPDELLRLAACMEEHFPHSMAKAVVEAAKVRGLSHDERHAKVEYVVAHGISTTIKGKKAVIGSQHFVFEDEKCVIPEGMQERFDAVPEEYSHLYLAVEGRLVAIICIEDPLRPEAADVIQNLKKAGISKVVMMTGDSDRIARAVASKVGVDEYYSEVLPEDKASFVDKERSAGRKVIMIGDGINDSPALSAADVGIAISDSAEIAREIADVTISADNLEELVKLKQISNGLIKRIHQNYRVIVGFNMGLIILGVAGILQPTTSALFHNTSTLLISLKSMTDLLSEV